MIYKKIQIDKEDQEAYLECYIGNKIGDFKKNAILVIPGGAYCYVSHREAEPVAMAFMPYGYNAFVLHCSCRKYPFPRHLIQASTAMKHIKDNAEEYVIDPEDVFVVGFSAGGHLAGSLATMWDNEEIYKKIKMPMGYNKPKGAMLIYPVINNHLESFKNLLMKENITQEEIKAHSIDTYAGENSSPMFIFHTSGDDVVSVKNSIDLAGKLSDSGVKFELHILPDGVHGGALFNEITAEGKDKWIVPRCTQWVKLAIQWAEDIKKSY